MYVADEQLRTVRYKTSEKQFQAASAITVFLDPRYLDPMQTNRSSEEYLPNSMVHHNGYLALFEPDRITEIKSWEDIPDSSTYESIRDGLAFVVWYPGEKKLSKKAPVSFVPKIGYHPIEFCNPDEHKYRHRNHFGDQIIDVSITNKLSDEDRKRAIEELALKSVKK